VDSFNQEEYQLAYQRVKDLLSQSQTIEFIESSLQSISKDPILIAVAIKEARKDYYAAMRKEGLARIMIGIILILSGFFITAFNFLSDQSFDFAMYGLTSIGLVFVFWGLYKLIG